MKRGHILFLGIIILVYLLMEVIVNPIANFPLNDDWMYSRSVLFILNLHDYKIVDQYSPVLVAQSIWGALFCLPFGYSFVTLRISVIVLAILGFIAFYFLLDKLSGNKIISFLGTLLLVCNPLFFSLSNTFMTDVPFLSFSLIAIYCFFRALENTGVITTVIATAATICAALTRQFGMVIPIAFVIVGLAQKRQGIIKYLLYIFPLVAVGWLLYFVMGRLQGKGYFPYNGNDVGNFLSNLALLFKQISERAGEVLYYCGFFL
ncbi:MAG TPA: glycosyltransferase family 39 protein, partial [Bacteroidia bacterium]|nr:glycosyltransferase family 39 protein [Bacteroidia bacterium]